ncbi:C4-dicarboxylate ABC transporter permease [Amylibacter sp. SFDW26]|uniref:tripartite tricarboxylate transporter permease n=1 Tax=Amylibacter sp. SFDW26 TaxID=2652722 RepID=UPI0012613E83|nr:tripartite tricarboxylate transporter permease [Amylibacter sp. SFDW26]KAB7613381.1 C4-dicarboxylate ABC transporter permease [Amylibacter sp. SFDW26]
MDIVLNAVQTVFALENLIFLVGGVASGVILGAIPGLSATMGIALIIPFTLTLGPVPALLMMMGAYKGGIYGGSVAAILVKAPGTSAAAATVADGYSLAKKGKGIKALKVSLVASVIGDTFSDIVLILSAAQLARVALEFGAVEYTAVAIVALTIVGSASGKSLIKGIFAAAAGLSVALIGLDPTSGLPRLSFSVIEFYGGLHLLPMLIGLLIMSELIIQMEQVKSVSVAHLPNSTERDDNRITKSDAKLMARPIFGGSIIGTIIGIIPGLGPTLGAFLGYDSAYRFSKKPELFGKGSVEGIAGAESGNNAVSGANLIPLMGLGIPGDIEAAILVGAFLIHGLTPGPLIFQEAPDVVYGIYVGLLFANVALLMIGWTLIPVFVKAAKIRVGLLFPAVFVLSLVGAYSFQQSVFDVGIALVFAAVGYLMAKLHVPKTSFLIGFILATLLEDNFRRSLQLSDGAYSTFFSSSLGNVLWVLALVSVISAILQRKSRRDKKEAMMSNREIETIASNGKV